MCAKLLIFHYAFLYSFILIRLYVMLFKSWKRAVKKMIKDYEHFRSNLAVLLDLIHQGWTGPSSCDLSIVALVKNVKNVEGETLCNFFWPKYLANPALPSPLHFSDSYLYGYTPWKVNTVEWTKTGPIKSIWIWYFFPLVDWCDVVICHES